MKRAGFIRRIDNLGRFGIPAEVRRRLNIKEGTLLELIVGSDGELILSKYDETESHRTAIEGTKDAVSTDYDLDGETRRKVTEKLDEVLRLLEGAGQ